MKVFVAAVAVALAAQVALAQPPEADQGDAARAPVVTDGSVRLDGPRTERDQGYETAVLGAFRTTQGRQGPLDGRWYIQGSDGVALYSLALTDPGAGEARIEGAWRKVGASGLGSSGFIENVVRDGEDVVFAFRDGVQERPAEVRLKLSPNGVWTGEMTVAGQKQGVVANRATGVETAAMAVPEWRPPPPPKPKATRTKAKAKSKSKLRRKR